MEIRKITPAERIEASKVQSIAFLSGSDFSAAVTDSEKFTKGYETGRAAFNKEGKLCACLELIPYEIRFDGNSVKMAGIGGVASLPEERNNGYIRDIFTQCFDEMRHNAQLFSYLYPFSHAYYRKFGYEACFNRVRTTVPLTSFKHFPNSGHVELYIPGTDDGVIRRMYSSFIVDKNLAVIRNDELWRRHIAEDPYKNNQFTYLWYNSDGEPKGYISFKAQAKEQFRSDLQVRELVWLDSDSLHGILGFLNCFVPRYENFIWEAPDFVNLRLLFPEPYNVRTEINSFGMNRIVDLQEVLKLSSHPDAEGDLVFEVYDNFLDWNNGTFAVTWGPDWVNVEKKSSPADLRCSIQVMTQLIAGYADIEDLYLHKDVKIYGKHKLISEYFRKKRLYINDYF
jgi:predicted acetyltransferase